MEPGKKEESDAGNRYFIASDPWLESLKNAIQDGEQNRSRDLLPENLWLKNACLARTGHRLKPLVKADHPFDGKANNMRGLAGGSWLIDIAKCTLEKANLSPGSYFVLACSWA